MDIFSKIDEQAPSPSVEEKQDVLQGGIIEQDGKYGYKFVADESKQDEIYEYYDAPKRYEGVGFFAEKRAERFYKFLLKPIKRGVTQKQYERLQKARMKKIQKFLKKGINFDKYFSLGMNAPLLETLPTDEIKLLYDHGFRIEETVRHIYAPEGVYSKKIYYGISQIDSEILRRMPTRMLERLIHTRKHLGISERAITAFVDNYYRYNETTVVRNIELLIKTGQVLLTPKQIITFCEHTDRLGYRLSPEIYALRDIAEGKMPKPDVGDKKYSTQKQLETKKETKKSSKKSEAQQVIDKLFEDAQNTVE